MVLNNSQKKIICDLRENSLPKEENSNLKCCEVCKKYFNGSYHEDSCPFLFSENYTKKSNKNVKNFDDVVKAFKGTKYEFVIEKIINAILAA